MMMMMMMMTMTTLKITINWQLDCSRTLHHQSLVVFLILLALHGDEALEQVM